MGGTYRDLIVWRKAMNLALEIYKLTDRLPDAEKYGLVSQLRRASVSIPSNIAEGKGRATDRDLLQFLACARGSVYELQTQLEIAGALGYASPASVRELTSNAAEVGRLLNGLITKMRLNTRKSLP